MCSKKWLLISLLGALSALLIIALFNYIADPFGVFGDRFLNWYGYNMTNNPMLAKFGYLDKNYNSYNGYIIGSSKASSLSPLQLNKYYENGSFYNLMTYGANFAHTENSMYYVIDNYNTKHIVLCLGLSELLNYGYETDDIKQQLHAKVSGDSLIQFYMKHLFLNPKYGMNKLIEFISKDKKASPSIVDVFLPETGVYNKINRDMENIININDYIAQIGDGTFSQNPNKSTLIDTDICISAIKRMRKYCDDKGITFTIISTPNYDLEIRTFDKEAVKKYWISLAKVQNFWNFSGFSSISYDPRYFYDTIHFRNIAGEMVLGKAFNDRDIYYPENFGYYFTEENAYGLSELLLKEKISENEYEAVPIPILLYHHLTIDDNPENIDTTISAGAFLNHMTALKNSGFTTLFIQDLIAYINGEEELPEKPILITFDDGYESNYSIAFPILKELDMKATISVVGWSVGRDTMPNGIDPIIPHFTWEQAKEMIGSGLVDIQSHSYDLHWTREREPYRDGVLLLENETSADYFLLMKEDNKQTISEMVVYLGKEPVAFAYPYGYADILAETVIRELGYKVTLLTDNSISLILKGDPYSLFGLHRMNVNNDLSIEELIAMCQLTNELTN